MKVAKLVRCKELPEIFTYRWSAEDSAKTENRCKEMEGGRLLMLFEHLDPAMSMLKPEIAPEFFSYVSKKKK